MRRSSRIIILLGVFLALIAFVGIVTLSRPGGEPAPSSAPTTTATVFAAMDIPLGTKVTEEMVRQAETPNAERAATAFPSTSLVIGKTIRRSVVAGAQLIEADFVSSGQSVVSVEVPAGLRAIAIQVNQLNGVGTIIQAGDYVDVVAGLKDPAFLGYLIDEDGVVTPLNASDAERTYDDFLSATTVKILVQGAQVLGILLPPPPVDANGRPIVTDGVALTGREQMVILGVTAQQAEVIKYALMEADLTLVLRAPGDFLDEEGEPIIPPPDETSGIVLKTLVDEYGVLLPEAIQEINRP